MKELKECPFCGCGAKHKVNSLRFDGSYITKVFCKGCYATVYGVDNESIDKWNVRESIPISKIEELIANCFDKHLPSALEDDLQEQINKVKP